MILLYVVIPLVEVSTDITYDYKSSYDAYIVDGRVDVNYYLLTKFQNYTIEKLEFIIKLNE
ncbi:MAG: hypothetical protein ACK5LV_09235 [Lachnospirales bacterium]